LANRSRSSPVPSRARLSITHVLVKCPQEASKYYIYGPAKNGFAGITEAASDFDNQLIDNVFKLLTSKYNGFKGLALSDVQTT
jgi:hypothetical protein